MKRAVLYARVSSDDRGKDGRNLKGQLDMCRKHSQEQGWEVIDELAEDDRGASGAEIDLPMLNRAREMAGLGQFDVLVVREIDRLSRNLVKQLMVENEFERQGVQIEYVLGDYPDTAEGRLNKHIKATIAEYEREKINERMIRGRRQKVQGGDVMLHGRAPYGYRAVEENGKNALAILEEEAKIVRLIYQWYTVGNGEEGPRSMGSITKTLSESQIPTPGDKHAQVPKEQGYGNWSRSTVQLILRSETYKGVWHYGKRGNDNSPNPDSYLIAVEVPAIIDEQTWNAAQERKKHNLSNSTRNQKYQYLLSRRVICGSCGAKMAGQGRSCKTKGPTIYYYCTVPTHPLEYARECDQTKYFRADEVEPAVWGWIKEILTTKEALTDGLRYRRERQEELNRPLRERLSLVEDDLSKTEGQMDRLLDLYLTGEFSKNRLAERQERLEEKLQRLRREKGDLQRQLEDNTISDGQTASLVAVINTIATMLEDADEEFEIRKRIVEMLDVQVTLGIEDGRKTIQAECRLGEENVSIASSSTQPTRVPHRSHRDRPSAH